MARTAASSAVLDGSIRLVIDGRVRDVRAVDPNRTVLEFLREDLGKTGTKEGCAEGDCGACTVVVAELDGERVRYRAVNACLQLLPTLDGKELITVENLKGPHGELHPVQRALVECHASQCGFCTPGFVMSLFALYKSERRPSRQRIDDVLSGNLCRCTGYRPIIAAAERMYEIADGLGDADRHRMSCSFESSAPARARGEREAHERLQSIRRRDGLTYECELEGGGPRRFFAPRDLDELATLRRRCPDAVVLAGGTDVGLWVTKQHRDLAAVIYVGGVEELGQIRVTDEHVEIGAAATLADLEPIVAAHYPDLAELLRRFASPPIRNTATLGGNIANASPIGDTMPALIALGATLVLRSGRRLRSLPLDRFYLDYRKTALRPGEFLERVRIPRLPPDRCLRFYKVSKRLDQDISAVCAAFCLQRDGGRVRSLRACFGGMAAIPQRARRLEAALRGRAWTQAGVSAAAAQLAHDFTPIDDMRASAEYRRRVAGNLLQRFFLESTGASGVRLEGGAT